MSHDPYADSQELARHYAAMNDLQLEELANVAYSLTESAKAALAEEITRRKADVKMTVTVPEIPRDSRVVRIRQFVNVAPALLAKSVLDSAGIECFLADENTVRIDWLYSNAIGGVKLLVREEDAEAASELLDQAPLNEFEIPESGMFKQPQCPKCGSNDVSYKGLMRNLAYGTIAAATFAVGIPFPVSHIAWYCKNCKNVWDGPDDSSQVTPPSMNHKSQ